MSFSSSSAVWLSLGQVAALTGYTLYCLNFILSARLKIFEPFFSGLNRIYIIHHLVGATAFVLLLYHPLMISVSYLNISLEAAAEILIPNTANMPVWFGIAALILTIVLLILTLYAKLEYNFWRKTHQYLGLALFLASMHVFLIGSTLDMSVALKVYMFILTGAAFASYIYRTLLGKFLINRYKFFIESVKNISPDILEIVLTPQNPSLNIRFSPGQFVFFGPKALGVLEQYHPFSITSPAGSQNISFAVKSVGDFTEQLQLLKPRNPVLIEGPYGRFGQYVPLGRNQLWIAGGIGITPFLSLARSLPEDFSGQIYLYYAVSDLSEAVYIDEFKNISAKHPGFHFILHSSKENGRLTADIISRQVPNLSQYEIFICGPPPMMTALKKQFILQHIRRGHIHTEEFSLS